MLCILCVMAVVVWYYPEWLLVPLNTMFSLDTSPRCNIYSEADMRTIFPASLELEREWQSIRDEGYDLYYAADREHTNYLDNYHMDLGSEDKKNWSTICLRVFGKDVPENMNACSTLGAMLRAHPEIKSCIFSIMEPGKIIQPHRGPYDGLLRYQLALDIPNGTDENCFVYVNEDRHYWRNGQGVLFDESNIHGAHNTTDKLRMVLLIDVYRPYNFTPFAWLNYIMVSSFGYVS